AEPFEKPLPAALTVAFPPGKATVLPDRPPSITVEGVIASTGVTLLVPTVSGPIFKPATAEPLNTMSICVADVPVTITALAPKTPAAFRAVWIFVAIVAGVPLAVIAAVVKTDPLGSVALSVNVPPVGVALKTS